MLRRAALGEPLPGLSGRSWVTLTKGPFSSLAALDLNIQRQWASEAVCRVGHKGVPPSSPQIPVGLAAFPHLRCDAPGCHSSKGHQRPPSACKLGTGGRKASPAQGRRGPGLPWVGGSLGAGAASSALHLLSRTTGIGCLWGLQAGDPRPLPSAFTGCGAG